MLNVKVPMMGATVFKSASGGDPWEALVSHERACLIFARIGIKNYDGETFTKRLEKVVSYNGDPNWRKSCFGFAPLSTGATLIFRKGQYFVSGYVSDGSDVRKALEA